MDSDDCLRSKNVSIIMQGPIFEKNLIECANNCKMWRENFPESEIIFVVSTSNILEKDKNKTFCICDNFKDDFALRAALNLIKKTSDKFFFLGSEIPLPHLKNDTGLCNGNYMIQSAQIGLRHATRKFVLRIRNDAVFFDRSFLKFYQKNVDRPRRNSIFFKKRIMIASNYTINPYATERLPFHWSDWFHFGLLEDVRYLWDTVPLITVQDSLFYKVKKFVPFSNPFERKFIHRLSVEQHINYSFFSKKDRSLKLQYHNDLSSRESSLEILRDNFVICDAYKLGFIFDKYKKDATQKKWEILCISNTLWNKLLYLDRKDYKEVFSFSKDIDILQLSPALKNTILIMSKFMNLRKKNKLFKNPKMFFNDSKNPIAKFIGELYKIENNINK